MRRLRTWRAARRKLPWPEHFALAGVAIAALTLLAGCSGGTAPAASSAPPAATVAVTPLALPPFSLTNAFPALPRLDRPTAMIEAPGGLLLVALQDGRVVSFPGDPGAVLLTPVLDWTAKTSRAGNEEGLLGMALDPGFERNGYLYIYYSAKPGDRRTVLSRLATSGHPGALTADPASEMVILTVPQPYANHKGGQLGFGPDGMLYLGLGDGGSAGDPEGNGQDLTRNLLGSIIRVDVRGATASQPYRIPPDNPFAGRTDGTMQETWAYGLRNPWRFSWDRETGVMWAGDVGQGQREEIDIIEKGKNYGWNVMEGSLCYRPSDGCAQSSLELPVVDYGHDHGQCSVTGGYVYRGKNVPALIGQYIYGDYCSGTVWAVPASATQGQSATAKELIPRGPQVASFAEDRAGEVYLLAFDGNVYRLTPAS